MNHTAARSSASLSDRSIEDIVLRYSGRGMTILQKYLKTGYCRHAAQKLLSLERGNVLLTTGFYVSGAAETDGPPGTLCLAMALSKLGFAPVIVTDRICEGLFESEYLLVEYVDINSDTAAYQQLLDRYKPVCLISIERCGHNMQNDYANMHGKSIAAQTAKIDTMFELAKKRNILTIGIGDGGNEIGMGNLKDIISQKMDLNPCIVPVDELIVATTSNWGAYALAAYLGLLMQEHIFPSYQELAKYLKKIVALGCVDGVTKQPQPSVDGFPLKIEKEIITALSDRMEEAYHDGSHRL